MRTLTLVLGVMLAGTARGQHNDIIIGVGAGALDTRDSASGLVAQVFRGQLGELSIPGWSNNPGYNSGSLSPNERIGFNIVGPLIYWDGSAYIAPPNLERLEVSLNGTTVATARWDSTFEPGIVFAVATQAGSIHVHLGYWVKHPDFDPGDPFNNPIAGPGAYALELELTSDMHESSPPFYIVFNNGLDPTSFDGAVAAAEDRLNPPACPGDLDGDGSVGIADLSALLSHFGATSGASEADGDSDADGDVDIADLAALLGMFGTTCP